MNSYDWIAANLPTALDLARASLERRLSESGCRRKRQLLNRLRQIADYPGLTESIDDVDEEAYRILEHLDRVLTEEQMLGVMNWLEY